MLLLPQPPDQASGRSHLVRNALLQLEECKSYQTNADNHCKCNSYPYLLNIQKPVETATTYNQAELAVAFLHYPTHTDDLSLIL